MPRISTDGQSQTSRRSPDQGSVTPPRVGPVPGRRRRRPVVIGLGVALTALGGLGAAWLATSTTQSTTALVVTHAVDAGQILAAGDVTVARISADPAIHAVPGDRIDTVVGKHATVRLLPGQVITPDSVSDGATLRPGTSLVGVAVTAAQMPAQVLQAGDRILIVDTPNPQDAPPTATPDAIPAEVLNLQPVPDTDKTIINVIVDAGQARALAARVATGRIGIVMLAAGQPG